MTCPSCGHKITLKQTQHKTILAYQCKGCGKCGTETVARNAPSIRVKPKEQRTTDGMTFASATEMEDYLVLKAKERAGEIKQLILQPKFPLTIVRPFTGESMEIGTYTADFQYVENGRLVVHDSKGHETREFKRTRKLMKAIYGIDVQTTLS